MPESNTTLKEHLSLPFNKWFVVASLIVLFTVLIYSSVYLNKKDCLIWKIDHYEKIDCGSNYPNPLLRAIDIEKLKKISVN